MTADAPDVTPLIRFVLAAGDQLGLQALAAEAAEEVAGKATTNHPSFVRLERCEGGYRASGPIRSDYETALADVRAFRSALTPTLMIVSPPFVMEDDQEG